MPARLLETPRDRQICLLIYRYNGVSIEIVKQAFWAKQSTIEAVYLRLARLIKQQYLEAFQMPSLSGKGSGKYWLGLGRRGRAVVAEELGLPIAQLSRIRQPQSALLYHHHLGICQVRLLLERAVAASGLFSLVDWLGEREYKSQPLGEAIDLDRKVRVFPDGGFALSFPLQGQAGYLHFVLEFDTGSENAKAAIRDKLRHYLLLCQQPKFACLLIVFVVPSQARAQTLMHFATEQGRQVGVDPSRIWFTTLPELRSSETAAIHEPIWQMTGPEPQRVSVERFAYQAAGLSVSSVDPVPASAGYRREEYP